jgi:hypothetical protein
MIDSGAIRGIICLLFLVKNRKEAVAGTLYDNTATIYTIDKSDASLGVPTPALNTITVANLQRITVLGLSGVLFSANFGRAPVFVAPLLLGD